MWLQDSGRLQPLRIFLTTRLPHGWDAEDSPRRMMKVVQSVDVVSIGGVSNAALDWPPQHGRLVSRRRRCSFG